MKLTIITVCYNSAETIADTIRSVAAQTFSSIEYIVVDGGSTDGTLHLVEQFGSIVTKLIHGPDKGIYDAMNKGICAATGDVIGFVNADDFYAAENVLSKVSAVFSDSEVDICYGDLCYVKQWDILSIVRYWRSSPFHPGLFEKGWCPPHPTFFVRRQFYERLGGFDLNFRLAADMELMMRLLEVHRVRARYLPELMIKMRMGGVTNRNLKNIVKQNGEILRALRQYGLRASVSRLIFGKMASRGLQFFTRPKL